MITWRRANTKKGKKRFKRWVASAQHRDYAILKYGAGWAGRVYSVTYYHGLVKTKMIYQTAYCESDDDCKALVETMEALCPNP